MLDRCADSEKILGGLYTMSKKVIDVLKAVNESGVAQELYNDAFKPTLSLIGTTVYRAVKVALSPLRSLVWSAEMLEEWVYTNVSSYLEGVPEEEIITPDPLIAVPLIEQVRISGKHEHLRDLYAKLLAKSMTKSEAERVLPSYVALISQLSALDVQLLEVLREEPGNRIPIADINVITNDGSYITEFTNVTLLQFSGTEFLSLAIDNITRMRLAEIPPTKWISPESIYDSFKLTSEYMHCEKVVGEYDNLKRVDVAKKALSLTNFGLAFIYTCK